MHPEDTPATKARYPRTRRAPVRAHARYADQLL